MSFVKETVDKLLKGYDIRLRPDFGGKSPPPPLQCLPLDTVHAPPPLCRHPVSHAAKGVKPSGRL